MIRVDACGDPLNIEGEGPGDEPLFFCDHCAAEDCSEVFDVETCRQTHGSPREVEQWCAQCCQTDPRERGADDGREYGHPRDALDDRRYR